jgi:hypothetical protein
MKFSTSDSRCFDADSGNSGVLGNICVESYALQRLRENSRVWEGRGAHRRSLRSGRDDNFVWERLGMVSKMNCQTKLSAKRKWRPGSAVVTALKLAAAMVGAGLT